MDDEAEKALKTDYPLIPMHQIDDEARLIAVKWCEVFIPHFAIEQKHKLASDLTNYARRVTENKNCPERGWTKGTDLEKILKFYENLYETTKTNLELYNAQYESLTYLEKQEFNKYIKTFKL